MAIGPSSGSKLYIGTTATNPVGDSYTQVGDISNLGEFGRVYAPIKFDSLSDRNTLKFKGQRDDGTMTIEIGRDSSDGGQAAVIVALDSDADYNFKITLNDASTTSGSTATYFLFKAKVMSHPTIIGTPNNVVMSRIVLDIKSGSITETAGT